MEKAQKRFIGIDLLRFFCAFLVLSFHCSCEFLGGCTGAAHNALKLLAEHGFLGVEIFFIISGFVILNSAINKTPKQFLIARILRLYPAFWVCCTITFLALIFFGAAGNKPGFIRYLINMTMLNSYVKVEGIDAPYWTLAYEIMFYAWIFALMIADKMRHYERFLIGGLAISTAYWLINYTGISVPAPIKAIFIIKYFCYFAIGSATFLWLNHRSQKLCIFVILYSLGLAFLEIDDIVKYRMLAYPEYGQEYKNYIAYIIFLSLFFVFIISIAAANLFKKKRIWSFLGNISYPLYLIHYAIGVIVFTYLIKYIDKYSALVIVTAFLITLSAVIHIYAELPIKRMLHKFLKKSPGKESVAPDLKERLI